MADTTEQNAATTQEGVQHQTVDGKLVGTGVGKPPQKPFTGDQIEQVGTGSAADSSSPQKSSQSNGQDAVSGRQRHSTSERISKDAVPSSTGSQADSDKKSSGSAVNGSAKAHVADDNTFSRSSTTHADQQSSTGGDVSGSGSKKRSAAESSLDNSGRRSRGSGDVAVHDPDASASKDLAAPGTTDDSKRAKIGEPVVLGGDSDKGPLKPSSPTKGSSGLGSAVDPNMPDLNKPVNDADNKTAGANEAAAASGVGGNVV